MIRTIGALALALLLPTGSFAAACGTTDLIDGIDAETRAELDALVAAHPYPEGNLWRATKDGSTVTVVGTMHMPDPRFDPMVERIEPVLREADLLILEVTETEMAAMETAAVEEPELFFFTDGPTLIDLLSEEDWAEVKSRIEELGVPGFMAAKFKPWYISMTLAMPPCAVAMVQSGEDGLDGRLEGIADEAGIPKAPLDNVDEMLDLLAGDPLDVQLESLRLGLSLNFDAEATASTLTEAYFDGRTREGWEYSRILIDDLGIEGGQEMFDEMNATLLDGRNQSWEPKIVELVEGKDVVLAVGAAHLSGETGVLRALERAGYLLERF